VGTEGLSRPPGDEDPADHPDVGRLDEFRTGERRAVRQRVGLTALMQKRIIRWLYCVPPCLARIKDSRAKYYTALRLSMGRNVGLIVAASPSTLINLPAPATRSARA